MNFFTAGRAFVLAGGPQGTHLFLVLTDPDPITRKVVTVMVVTPRVHTDKTVTIGASDHPWLDHDSNVDYGGSTFVPVGKLEGASRSGRLTLQADMTPALLDVARAGLLASSFTPNGIKEYCTPIFAP